MTDGSDELGRTLVPALDEAGDPGPPAEAVADPVRLPMGPLIGALGVALVLPLTLALSGVAVLIAFATGYRTSMAAEPMLLWTTTLGMQSAFVLGPALALRWQRLSVRDGLALRPVRWWVPLVAVAGLWAAGLAGHALMGQVQHLLPDHYGALDIIAETLTALDPTQRALLVVVLAVLPPIGEEVLFRGLLHSALSAAWGGVVAVAVTAVLFAVIHLDPVQGSVALVLGLYLGALRQATGSIVPGMIAHGANNLVAALVLPQLTPSPGGQLSFGAPPWPIVVGGLVVAALALVALRRWRE